jgi:predicted dipeptidase
MTRVAKAALGAALIALFVIRPAAAASGEFGVGEIAELLDRHAEIGAVEFREFAGKVRGGARQASLSDALDRYLAGETLDEAAWIDISRLLGVYVRLRHRDALIRMLGELVAIPTDKKDEVAQHENPRVRRLGQAIARIAAQFGLGYRNVDNRIFEVLLAGNGDESIGVFTHGDVVPADPTKWVLPDGRRLDPFEMTRIGDRLYGRGTSDDKSAIVTALFAMAAIKRAGFGLRRTIRLIVETTEETGGQATEYYKRKHALPPYNIVLDGRYPVGVAEKGFGVVTARFPVRAGAGEGAEIVSASGGLVVNQIPSSATAEIVTRDPSALTAAIDRAAAKYVAANGGNFRISATTAAERLTLTVVGQSTHSAAPQRGVNPVSRLFDFLHAVRGEVRFKRNHFTDAAAYAADNWGIDYLGSKLGVGYADPFMGPLTAAITKVEIKNGMLRLAVNTRAPKGKEAGQLTEEIRSALDAWRQRTRTNVSFDLKLGTYMYRNPSGPWIATLLDIFSGVTGLPGKPVSSSGYTTAHQLPNGVQFGPGMPGEVGTAHRANEYKNLGNFLRDAQIVTEMMMRLGNLPRME